MIENTGQVRIILTFSIMLVTAMLLQSVVVLFLGLRAHIQEDVTLAKQILKKSVVAVSSRVEEGGEQYSIDGLQDVNSTKFFSCVYQEQAVATKTEWGTCRFFDPLRVLAEEAREKRVSVVRYVGRGWYSMLSLGEVAIIAVPVVDDTGQVIGNIAAERSLLPIYTRSFRDLRISLSYLLVNAVLFSILFFFRISKYFFRPLEKLVEKAESHQHGAQRFVLVSDDASPFRKLSAGLNSLIDRIEADNRMLRRNVQELEKVNKELQEKNDLVMRSEKLASVGRLSAGLAHEIGNPLSIIQGYVELLSRDDLSGEEKQQFSEKAQQELDRIQRLIRQLLNFAGTKRSVCETVPVNDLIREVVDFVSMEKSEGESFLHTQLMAEDDHLLAERDALRQVLINCLLNAVDATGELAREERDITISTANEQNESGQARLIIRIRDNGTGICEDDLQYVFDPFYTTKEVGRGTGLGLFVSNAIVEGLGGTIALGNRQPAGVEVVISFASR